MQPLLLQSSENIFKKLSGLTLILLGAPRPEQRGHGTFTARLCPWFAAAATMVIWILQDVATCYVRLCGILVAQPWTGLQSQAEFAMLKAARVSCAFQSSLV